MTDSAFNEIEQFGPDNAAAYTRLVETLATRNAIGVVGAGLSVRLGYPTWDQLMAKLREHAILYAPEEAARLKSLADELGDDPLVEADQLKAVLGSANYEGFLKDTFAPRNPAYDVSHSLLLQLGLRHILTTNYDGSIEAAFLADRRSKMPTALLAAPESGHFFNSILEKSEHCVHLHGVIHRPETIVLTLADYNGLYKAGHTAAPLTSVFATFPSVFVGFGMCDADLLDPFRFLGALLPTNAKFKHFALVAANRRAEADARRTQLRSRYRIDPIFYDPADRHRALVTVLRQILSDLHITLDGRLVVELSSAGKVIDSLLSHRPDLGSDLKRGMEASARPAHEFVLEIGRSVADSTRTPLDDEIDTVFELVRSGSPQVAIKRYEEILGRSGSSHSERITYRIHANIGHARYNMADFDGAANAYLRAVAFFKSSEDSLFVEALAYLLKRDHRRAHELASAVCTKYPDYGRARSVWVQSAPETLSFDRIEASIRPKHRRLGEVALALGHCANERGLTDKAGQYLRDAVAGEPEWTHALDALATLLLQRCKRSTRFDPVGGFIALSPSDAQEAESLLTRAIATIRPSDPGHQLARLYWNRSIAWRYLGRPQESRADVSEASRRTTCDPQVLFAEALAREEEGRVDSAIELLADANDCAQPSRRDLLLALCFWNRNSPNDRSQARQLVWPWLAELSAVQEGSDRADLLRLAIRLCDKNVDRDQVKAALEAANDDCIPTIPRLLIRIRLSMAGSNEEEARELVTEATKAVQSLPRPGPEHLDLAILAEELSKWSEACQLWKLLASPGRFDMSARGLLRTAERAHEEALALDFCASLRQHGIHEREAYLLEAELLARCREPDTAMTLLESWLAEHEDDLDARLRLSVIARQNHAHNRAESSPERLPSVTSVPNAEYGATVAFVLRYGTQPKAGVEYAYQIYRRFSDNKQARRSLIAAVYDWRPRVELGAPTVVSAGTAVQLKTEQDTRWIVIEEGPDPSPTRSEYGPTHPFAAALLGLAVGESVEYARAKCCIVGIAAPAVLRAHECMELDERLSPDDPMVRRYSVPENLPKAPRLEQLLGTGWDDLKATEERREALGKLYQHQGVFLPMIAMVMGRTVFQTACHYASSPDVPVICALLQSREMADGILTGDRPVVLDSTALATMFLLGCFKHVFRTSVSFVVPRAVLDEVRSLITETKYGDTPRLSLEVHRGRPRVRKYSRAEIEADVKRLSWLEKCVSAHCDVSGGRPVLSLPGRLRHQLEGRLPPSTIDAIAIARFRHGILWTDDQGTACLAAGSGVDGRIWTQVAMIRAVRDGAMSNSTVTRCTYELLRRDYIFTSLDALTMVELMRRDRWRLTRTGFGAIRKHALAVAGASVNNAAIFARVIVGIWSDCPDESRARRLVWKLLDVIAMRWRADRIVERLMQGQFGHPDLTPAEVHRLFLALRCWTKRQRRRRRQEATKAQGAIEQ